MILLFLLFSIQILFVVAASREPSLKITVSANALQYVADTYRPTVVEKIKTVQIPNFEETDHTKIGKVKFDLQNFKIDSASIAHIGVKPQSTHVLVSSVTDLAIALSGDFHYRKEHWPHVSGHGTFDISIDKTDISVASQLLEINGQGSVKAQGCSVKLGGFHLKVHGHSSWIYNFIIHQFRHKIESAIVNGAETAICSAINTDLNNVLASLPVKEPFGQYYGVDYALTEAPSVLATGLTFASEGELYAQHHTGLDGCQPTPLPDAPNKQNMLQLVVGRCSFDSIGWTLYTAGSLNTILNDQNLPNGLKFNLTTNYFEFIIPALYKKYPNRRMQMEVFASKAPITKISKNGFDISSVVNFNVSVLPTTNNTKPTPVFTMIAETSTSALISLNGTTLYPKLVFNSSEAKLAWSDVGTGFGYLLSPIISYGIEYVLIPGLNVELKQGIQIPNVGPVSLKNADLSFDKDFMLIGLDFTLNPNLKATQPHVDKHAAILIQQ